jgi:hypothetical protein
MSSGLISCIARNSVLVLLLRVPCYLRLTTPPLQLVRLPQILDFTAQPLNAVANFIQPQPIADYIFTSAAVYLSQRTVT